MHGRHQVGDGGCLLLQVGAGLHLHDHLVELVLERVLVELPQRSGDRDVDVVVGILDLDPLELRLLDVTVGQHSDHREPLVVDLDLLADHVAEAEELLLGRDPEHADLVRRVLVERQKERAL